MCDFDLKGNSIQSVVPKEHVDTPRKETVEEPVCDEPCLSFRVRSNDGGELSTTYGCANLLRNDLSCFCSTSRDNVTVVFEYAGGSNCVLTSVEVVNPSKGYYAPVSQCLVFVCWDLPKATDLAYYDNIKGLSALENRLEERIAEAGVLSEKDPVALVDLSQGNRKLVHLDSPKAGRFVVLKFLGPKFSFCDNIDVQFVGLRGFSRPMGFASAACC